MIKLSKMSFKACFQISGYNVKCSYGTLKKLVSLFKTEYIVVTVDSIEKSTTFFKFLEDNKLEYMILKEIFQYLEVAVKVPLEVREVFLKEIINNNPENIFIFDIKEKDMWKEKLQYAKETIVDNKKTNIFVTISCDENAFLLIAGKKEYDIKKVYSYLKSNLHN